MGNFCSKTDIDKIVNNDIQNSNTENRILDYDKRLIQQFKRDLYEDPEIFILNNLMLSIQFFENFEREMDELKTNQVSTSEIKLNEQLLLHRKHCLLPDTLFELVNKRVKFRTFHGPRKLLVEHFLPQRLFIVHDNIEVVSPEKSSEYSLVDGPTYRMKIDTADRKGYVQLRILENINKDKLMNNNEDYDDEVFDGNFPGTSKYSQKTRLYNKNRKLSSSSSFKRNDTFLFFNDKETSSTITAPKLKLKTLRTQSLKALDRKGEEFVTSMLTRSTENVANIKNEDEYTLQDKTSPRSPNEITMDNKVTDPDYLPDNCIILKQKRKIALETESDDEYDDIQKHNLFETLYYLKSTEFSYYFINIFINTAEIFGFSKKQIEEVSSQNGIIYCNSTDTEAHQIHYEIFPAVSTAWPEIAFEWELRQRTQVIDPNYKVLYEWPTRKMVKKIKFLQANIVPISCSSNGDVNSEATLEWSLAFPAAERYLESSMSHSQIRCYLFIIALYKTFMENNDIKIGLNINHIRNVVFWECEKNYITWPEDRLGTKMLRVLKSLYQNLSRSHLSDYFLPEKNLLENTPSKYLRISQAKLNDILQHPVGHMLIALQNLKFTTNSFPTLNYEQLRKILIADDSVLLFNPGMARTVEKNEEIEVSDTEENENSAQFWENAKHVDRERKWKRQFRKLTEIEQTKQMNLIEEQRKNSTDSLDSKLLIPKILDTYKRRMLLEFFIKHFISIAKKMIEYQSNKEAMFYLNHCKILTKFLVEEPSGEVEARSLKIEIYKLFKKCLMITRKENVPENPRKQNQQFSSMQGTTTNYSINLNKLQDAYFDTNRNNDNNASEEHTSTSESCTSKRSSSFDSTSEYDTRL